MVNLFGTYLERRQNNVIVAAVTSLRIKQGKYFTTARICFTRSSQILTLLNRVTRSDVKTGG